MLPEWLDATVFGVVFLGSVGAGLGLAGLMSRSLRRTAAVPAMLAAILAATALALAGAGLPHDAWLGPLFVAGFCAAIAALRSDYVGRIVHAVLAVASRPKLQWAALVVVSPAAAIGWQWVSEPVIEEWSRPPDLVAAHEPVPLLRHGKQTAWTDYGRTIPLYSPAAPASAANLSACDNAVFTNGDFAARALRVGPPTDSFNCHGWTFSHGLYWIQGPDAETILADNGYLLVAEPQPGDLIIYRGYGGGPIQHSGIVFSAGPDRPVLVQTKWGKGGLYVHPPKDMPYPGDYFYYRSPRTGHLLHGISDTNPLPPLTTVAGS